MSAISEASRFALWLIKYLGFRFWLWFVLSLCLYGVWAGLDGLSINFSSNTLKQMSVEDVEKNGVGGNRYINITGGLRGDVYVYHQRLKQVESVLYPVVSYLEHSSLAPDYKVRVVVKWPLSMSVDSFENWVNENLAIEANDLSGIVLSGWDAFDADDTKLLRSMGVIFHEDLILIKKGAKPVSPLLNIIYFLGGIAGLYFIFIKEYMSYREQTASNKLMDKDTE